VTAEAEVLNTSDSFINNVVGDELVKNLPTLRRQYTDFALLSPSVTVDGQFGSVSFAGSQGDYTSNYANGNGGNSFSVDGANSTSRYLSEQRMETRIPYVFGLESVQEFQVSENPHSHGGGAAGYVNTITKSGTNAFHGHAFYYNRNTGTGAIDAVSKAAGYPKALDVRQQFGAGMGGPIMKNKLFFFFDYEQQRRKDPISIINTAQAAVNQTSFGVPAGTVLPAPNGFPVPSGLTAADPTNPVYLQQVSNALHQIQSNLGFYPRRQDDLVFFERFDWLATAKDQVSMRYNYNTFTSPGSATSNPITTTGQQAYSDDAAQVSEAASESSDSADRHLQQRLRPLGATVRVRLPSVFAHSDPRRNGHLPRIPVIQELHYRHNHERTREFAVSPVVRLQQRAGSERAGGGFPQRAADDIAVVCGFGQRQRDRSRVEGSGDVAGPSARVSPR